MKQKKINSGNKIFVYGNGGSLADSMHFVGELVSTYKKKKKKITSFYKSIYKYCIFNCMVK